MEKQRRGFAAMSQEKRSEIARKGGRAAHVKGTAHQFTSEEAREAGRKGGQTTAKNTEHMSEIGRKGGAARAQRAQEILDASDAARANPDASSGGDA